jgi:ATP-dependent Lhr-like helicase
MEEKLKEIKGKLPRVWHAFFGNFEKLLPIQEKVIPYVLEGKNLVISSPAATGKTEAVCAPLLERVLKEKWNGLSILYLSPTRSLVNDIYRRLYHPLQYLRVGIARKTLDRSELSLKNIAPFLITTPESFDSLLARQPQIFKTLRAVCLDEIHLYDNTPRGDALRVQLKRLEAIAETELNFYALSATIASPYDVGKRYFSPFEVVVLSIPRRINYTLHPVSRGLNNLLKELQKKALKKILIFCNTRAETEKLVYEIAKEFKGRVWAHHGSLSKHTREAVEERMLKSSIGIIVATPTLELGIDVGDIDGVLFWRIPSSCFSLLQRLGRSNRRGGDLVAFGVYRDNWEAFSYRVMFELVKRGWLEEESYSPHYSVAIQQSLSYVHQRRRIGTSFEKLLSILSPLEISEKALGEIIRKLVKAKYFKIDPAGLIYLDERAEGLVTRGNVHSNIEKSLTGYEVVEMSTARVIGTLDRALPNFLLGGKFWKTEAIKRKKLLVRECSKISRSQKGFLGKTFPIWDWRLGFHFKLALFRHLPELTLPLIPLDQDHSLVLHFLGRVHSFLWGEILINRGLTGIEVDEIGLTCRRDDWIDLQNITLEEVERVVKEKLPLFTAFFSLGPWFSTLPLRLQQENILMKLKATRFIKLVNAFSFTSISCDEAKRLNLENFE